MYLKCVIIEHLKNKQKHYCQELDLTMDLEFFDSSMTTLALLKSQITWSLVIYKFSSSKI